MIADGNKKTAMRRKERLRVASDQSKLVVRLSANYDFQMYADKQETLLCEQMDVPKKSKAMV